MFRTLTTLFVVCFLTIAALARNDKNVCEVHVSRRNHASGKVRLVIQAGVLIIPGKNSLSNTLQDTDKNVVTLRLGETKQIQGHNKKCIRTENGKLGHIEVGEFGNPAWIILTSFTDSDGKPMCSYSKGSLRYVMSFKQGETKLHRGVPHKCVENADGTASRVRVEVCFIT